MTEPAITDQAIEAGLDALIEHAVANGVRRPSPRGRAVMREQAIAVASAAAPHIAAQERAKIVNGLLDTANDERARPSRDCCSMAIEGAYRDAAENVNGRPGSSAPTRTTDGASPLYVIVRTRPGIDGMTVTNVGGIAYRDRESAQAAADILRRVADVTEGHEDQGAALTVHQLVPVEAGNTREPVYALDPDDCEHGRWNPDNGQCLDCGHHS